jgi:hypothetical protein
MSELRMTNRERETGRSRFDNSTLAIRPSQFGSGFPPGLAQAGDAVAFFPLTTLFHNLDALKTLEHIALATQNGGRAQTAML